MPDYKAFYTYYVATFNGSHLVPRASRKTYEFPADSLDAARELAEERKKEIPSNFNRKTTLDSVVEM